MAETNTPLTSEILEQQTTKRFDDLIEKINTSESLSDEAKTQTVGTLENLKQQTIERHDTLTNDIHHIEGQASTLGNPDEMTEKLTTALKTVTSRYDTSKEDFKLNQLAALDDLPLDDAQKNSIKETLTENGKDETQFIEATHDNAEKYYDLLYRNYLKSLIDNDYQKVTNWNRFAADATELSVSLGGENNGFKLEGPDTGQLDLRKAPDTAPKRYAKRAGKTLAIFSGLVMLRFIAGGWDKPEAEVKPDNRGGANISFPAMWSDKRKRQAIGKVMAHAKANGVPQMDLSGVPKHLLKGAYLEARILGYKHEDVIGLPTKLTKDAKRMQRLQARGDKFQAEFQKQIGMESKEFTLPPEHDLNKIMPPKKTELELDDDADDSLMNIRGSEGPEDNAEFELEASDPLPPRQQTNLMGGVDALVKMRSPRPGSGPRDEEEEEEHIVPNRPPH